MRSLRTAVLACLFAAFPLLAADPKECLDLRASIDTDVSSPMGIRVTVNGRNRCSEDIDGSRCRFKVEAIGSGGAVIATQTGRFGGTVASHGAVESKVFLSCDPERVRSIRVEPR